MKELSIIHDYKTLALPLDMIAKKNDTTLAFIINTLYRATVAIPQSITESKKILKEFESDF